MFVVYYFWSLVADVFLFLRGMVYKVMFIPLMRVDVLAWLFIAGYAVFKVWWPPLSGQSEWSAPSAAFSATMFLVVALTFKLLFNKERFFSKGWPAALTEKAYHYPEAEGAVKVTLAIGSGDAETRHVAFSESSLFLLLEHDSKRGAEFPFKETSVEVGKLYRYFTVRPALRLRTKAFDGAAYVFKADPAVLFAIYTLITSKQPPAPPLKHWSKKFLLPTALAAGMLLASTFGLWRVTTIIKPEVKYPVGVINSDRVGLYELPNPNSKLISSLKSGEEVLVINGTENWYYVLRSSEQAGYVSKGFVSPK